MKTRRNSPKSNDRPDERPAPDNASSKKQKSKLAELPPNENIQKDPDEVYGDTEIPKSHRNKQAR